MSAPRLARSISVAGFRSCGFYRLATEIAHNKFGQANVKSLPFETREDFHRWLSSSEVREQFSAQPGALAHTSSPFVYADRDAYIGGYDDLVSQLKGHESSPKALLALPETFPGENGLASAYSGVNDKGDEAFRKLLSPTQFMVLRHGATEERGVGIAKGGFDDVFESPCTYECAGCAMPLYASSMKFDCGCGWAGFFACIEDSIYARPDKDGVRTEIVCNGCGGHLGHVYANEGFRGMSCAVSGNVVDTDHRHCVNSAAIAMRFADGSVRPSTFKGRIFLDSHRMPDNQKAPTTLSRPWSEEAGGLLSDQ